MTQLQPTTSRTVDAAWTAADLEQNPHARPDKAVRVRRMFAAIAKRYDLNNRIHSLGLDQVWRRRAVKLAQIKPSDDVLDVACGTGDLTFAFARANPRAITGLDFTEPMLEVARVKSVRWRRGIKPTFVQGDAMSLPFENNSFDAVSIAFGIRNVADPAQALREFHRVLRPGGRLLILEFSEPNQPLLRWINRFYTQRIMPRTATLIAGDRSGAYCYLPKSICTFFDPGAFTRLLENCGFDRPRLKTMTFGVCTVYVTSPRAVSQIGVDNRA